MWRVTHLLFLFNLALLHTSASSQQEKSDFHVIVIQLTQGKEGVPKIQEVLSNKLQKQVHILHARKDGIISLLVSGRVLKKALKYIKQLTTKNDIISDTRIPDIKITNGWNNGRRKRSIEDFQLESYNTYSSINEYLEELAAEYPDLCETAVIGLTFEGREIKLIKVHGSQAASSRVRVFFDGAQHAREWISPAVLVYMINQFVTGYNANTRWIVDLLDKYEFHILPILNPDGYEYTYNNNRSSTTRFWRKNRKTINGTRCVGVDLNRNWGFHWSGQGGSQYPCSDVYFGATEFSEEETKAVATHISRYRGTWHSYFSFHSFGQLILFPWSHSPTPSPDFFHHLSASKKLAKGIKQLQNTTYSVGSVGGLLYAASGSSESWSYAPGQIPYSYTIELPNLYNFILPRDRIAPTAQELMTGFRYYFNHIETTRPEVYDQLLNSTYNIMNVSTTPMPASTQTEQTTINYSRKLQPLSTGAMDTTSVTISKMGANSKASTSTANNLFTDSYTLFPKGQTTPTFFQGVITDDIVTKPASSKQPEMLKSMYNSSSSILANVGVFITNYILYFIFLYVLL